MNHQITHEDRAYLQKLQTFHRLRIKNYADKKGLTYKQALNYLIRRNFEQQKIELDNNVDPKYHSSNEPK